MVEQFHSNCEIKAIILEEKKTSNTNHEDYFSYCVVGIVSVTQYFSLFSLWMIYRFLWAVGSVLYCMCRKQTSEQLWSIWRAASSAPSGPRPPLHRSEQPEPHSAPLSEWDTATSPQRWRILPRQRPEGRRAERVFHGERGKDRGFCGRRDLMSHQACGKQGITKEYQEHGRKKRSFLELQL